MIAQRRSVALGIALIAAGIAVSAVPLRAAAAETAPAQQTFASPEEAVKALRAAAEADDHAALRNIFGPEIHELLTGDKKQDQANSKKFARAMAEGVKPITETADRVVLEVGSNKWPFPIPLVKESSAWHFDTAAGKEEIIDRHIGKDELHAIGICEAYAEAKTRGGNFPVPKRQHGYSFKILAGRKNGLAAYPQHWGRSGIMTFLVNQDGKIYQRDFGEKTPQLAAAVAGYGSGEGWTLVKDKGVREP